MAYELNTALERISEFMENQNALNIGYKQQIERLQWRHSSLRKALRAFTFILTVLSMAFILHIVKGIS